MNCNLNEVHSSHVFSTKLCSDCVGYPFLIIAVLHQRSVCWSSLTLPIWVCVFSHFVLVRSLMIAPENRVAMAPLEKEESVNSTIIIIASCAQNQPLSSAIFAHVKSIFFIVGSGALLVVVDFPWNIRVLLGLFRANC